MSAAREVATAVVRRLREAGHEAFLVGGCVREILLGAEPEDYDVTTDATPDEVAALFSRVVEVGKQFGVVRVVDGDVVTEVATFRTEGSYTDGRRPDDVRFATAAEDVSRRDFTVNALLMDPETGEIVDHVGGRSDLERRILRTVGDAHERFAEDRLRLLRAVRFTARLGFTLHGAARAACVDLAPRVTSVSPERIREELSRMLAHETRGVAVHLLRDLRLLEHVLPEVHALRDIPRKGDCTCDGGTALDHVLGAVGRLRPEASEDAAWATLLHEVGLPAVATAARQGVTFARHEVEGAEVARAVMTRLRASSAQRDRVGCLVRDHLLPRESPGFGLAKLRQVLALPWLDDLLDVARAEGDGIADLTAGLAHLEEARERWGCRLPPPLVSGDDLLALGVARGPSLGRVLDALRAEQLEERLQSKDDALRRARELAD